MRRLLHAENTSGQIDPLRFSCDLGKLADALLLYDEVRLVTDNYREVVGAIHWLTPPLALRLMRERVLTFVLLQAPIQVIRINNGPFRVGALSVGSKHHPPKDAPYRDTYLHNRRQLLRYLRGYFRSGSYLPENWSSSDDLELEVARATVLLPAGFDQQVLDLVVKALATQEGAAPFVEMLLPGLGRPSVLAPGLQLNDDGVFTSPFFTNSVAAEHALGDLNHLVSTINEIAVAATCDVSAYVGPPGADEVLITALRGYTGTREVAFNQVLRFEDLPRLGAAVHTDGLDGRAIVRLRETAEARRLRSWFKLHESQGATPEDVVKDYVQALGKAVRTDSLSFFTLRQLALAGLGLASGGAGGFVLSTLGSVGEASVTKHLFRGVWTPRVFLDDELRRVVTKVGSEPQIPIDPAAFLREGARVRRFHRAVGETTVEFETEPGGMTTVGYGNDESSIEVLNRRFAQLLAVADGDFLLDCAECGKTNRLSRSCEPAKQPSCGSCGNRLLPLTPFKGSP